MNNYLTLENIKNAKVGDRFWFHLKIDPIGIFPEVNRDISVRLIEKNNNEALLDQVDILHLVSIDACRDRITEYIEKISQAIPIKNKTFILSEDQYFKLPSYWRDKCYQKKSHNFCLTRGYSFVATDYDFSDHLCGLSFSFCVNFKSVKYNLE